MWNCQNCQENIEDKYKNCWNCGQPKLEFQIFVAKVTQAEPQVIKETKNETVTEEPIIEKSIIAEPEIANAKPTYEDNFLSTYDSQTDEKPPSIIRKILPFLLWLTVLIASASFAYLSTQKTTNFMVKMSEEAANFNQLKDQFVFPSLLPDRKNQIKVEGYIKGKVLPLNRKNKEVDGVYYDLPDDLRATNIEEAKTLMWLDCQSEKVGIYTDNAIGYQEICKVFLVEKDTSIIIGIQDFRGLQPKHSKEYKGDATGKVLPEKYIFYLREKQLESERTEMKYPSDSPNHHIFNKSEFLIAFLILMMLGAIGFGWIAYKIKFDWDAD